MISNTATVEHAPAATAVILVVEDDVLIRAATAQYLRGAGYVVLEAVDVPEAVRMLQTMPTIRLALSDIKLPGAMSGVDLWEIIKRDFPNVKALFTSGVVAQDELVHTDIPFVRKPYFLFEIERKIKEALSA
jgi:CheY-like chemotaxis protein